MLDMLTWILSGDSLAAEYTLLHLLSSMCVQFVIVVGSKFFLPFAVMDVRKSWPWGSYPLISLIVFKGYLMIFTSF